MKELEKYIELFRVRKKNVRFREIQQALIETGFEMKQQKRGGSHYVFRHPQLDTIVVLVSHGRNDVLPEYQVAKSLKALEQLLIKRDLP